MGCAEGDEGFQSANHIPLSSDRAGFETAWLQLSKLLVLTDHSHEKSTWRSWIAAKEFTLNHVNCYIEETIIILYTHYGNLI